MVEKRSTVNILTLGCSKNKVDSEVLGAQLQAMGFEVVHDSEKISNFVVINTCGFIGDAKEESVDTILSYASLRKRRKIAKLVVMGCLSERYKKDLEREIHEVDAFYGVNDQSLIPAFFQLVAPRREQPDSCQSVRVLSTPSHYAYLKISEGCDRSCAFCAIPGIRGRHISRTIESLVKETSELANGGVKEIILIAQELTYYGIDLHAKRMLPELITQLSQIEGIEWIRLQYAYPQQFPDELIRVIADNPKVCKYIDLPLQHISSKVLDSMRRNISREKTIELVNKIRTSVPEIAFRTTFITGFPTETENDFEELYQFVKESRFDRVGVFTYSHEEDTPAFLLNDVVPEAIKQERMEKLMSLQQDISLEINESKIGRVERVIIDKIEGEYYIGRTQYDSPEVDNEVLIPAGNELEPGNFYNVEITAAAHFDLYAKVI